MDIMEWAEKVGDRFAPRVARTLGYDNGGMDIQYVAQDDLTESSDDGRLAQGGGGVITFDSDWLASASRRDIRGAVIHELAHAIGGASETEADYARYVLNPKEANYWKPSEDVLKMANQNNNNQGRLRNKFTNIMSKYEVGAPNPGGQAAIPALPPGEEAAYFAQLANYAAQARQAAAAARTQRVGIKANLKTSIADVKGQAVDAMAAAAGQASELSQVGSSYDIGQRIGVEADLAAGKASAKSTALQELAQNRLELQSTQLGIGQEQLSLETQRAARQSDLLAAQLQNNLIISGQESTMDAIKAMYKAIMAGQTPPRKNGEDMPTTAYPGVPQEYLQAFLSGGTAPPSTYRGQR